MLMSASVSAHWLCRDSGGDLYPTRPPTDDHFRVPHGLRFVEVQFELLGDWFSRLTASPWNNLAITDLKGHAQFHSDPSYSIDARGLSTVLVVLDSLACNPCSSAQFVPTDFATRS